MTFSVLYAHGTDLTNVFATGFLNCPQYFRQLQRMVRSSPQKRHERDDDELLYGR